MPRKAEWTRESAAEALKSFLAARDGEPPADWCSWKEYAKLRTGHLEWPHVRDLSRLFGTVREAMIAAGANEATLPRDGMEWEDTEDVLLEALRAAKKPWPEIATVLRRSEASCKQHMWVLRKARKDALEAVSAG